MVNRATRCPHCQTSFRVTDSQLATARGRVRCGACLEVFNATENWVDPSPAQAPIPEPEPRYDDNSPLPEDIEHAEAGEPDTSANSAEPNVAPEAEQAEPWQDEAVIEQRDSFEESQAQDEPQTPFEDEDEEAVEPEYRDSPTEPEIEDETTAETETGEVAAQEATPEPDPTPADDEFDSLVARQRRRIQLDRRQLGWSLLCLLASAVLAGQAVYANFDSLAQSQHRNTLAETCEVINWAWGKNRCELPPPSNLARIESLGLSIMSHPRFADSLLVDAIILNTARFEQPFPRIELTFRNDRGNIVARRAFTPDEYLAGELRGIELMPIGQSVRLNISIADPGSTAVNYEMQFLAATEQRLH